MNSVLAFGFTTFILIYWTIYKTCSYLYYKCNSGYGRKIQHELYFTKYEYEVGVAERELRFERFAAWTECPRCLYFNLHGIKDSLPKSCRRQCDKCKYVWRQV